MRLIRAKRGRYGARRGAVGRSENKNRQRSLTSWARSRRGRSARGGSRSARGRGREGRGRRREEGKQRAGGPGENAQKQEQGPPPPAPFAPCRPRRRGSPRGAGLGGGPDRSARLEDGGEQLLRTLEAALRLLL